MFITKVKTRTSKSGTDYYTYKLLTSARLGVVGSPKVKTVLNLGAGFSFPSEHWKELAGRVEQILCGETSLFPCRPEVEKEAMRLVSAIKANSSSTGTESNRYISLDGYYLYGIGSKHHRTIGVEYIGLYATNQSQLPQLLFNLGYYKEQIQIFLALIIGRMANPGSEASTYNWLIKNSVLGELLGIDFNTRSVMALHRG
jgi:hypothetical protein